MVVIIIRTLLIFITLTVVMRLMGKRQIGEMQPFEFIVTLIIADLACIPMADVSIPLVYGIVAILSLFFLHQLLSFLEQCGPTCKRIISGKPSIVIDKNGICLNELKRNNMGIDDLIESMRSAGYFSLDDVDYAIFESNGKLSALPSSNNSGTNASIPVLLINEGKTLKENLYVIRKNDQDVDRFLTENGEKKCRVEVMTIDGNGRVYLKIKNKKYRILNFPLEEKNKW